jgi:hypothetical protein
MDKRIALLSESEWLTATAASSAIWNANLALQVQRRGQAELLFDEPRRLKKKKVVGGAAWHLHSL